MKKETQTLIEDTIDGILKDPYDKVVPELIRTMCEAIYQEGKQDGLDIGLQIIKSRTTHN